MADLTADFRRTAFSTYNARRCRMTSRIPPVSPASIMLVVRSSKTAGYWRIAFARVAPPSTVVRTPFSVFWKVWLSWLAARISRHCTRGKPASIMTENCRKKMAISLVLTLPEPKKGSENSFPFSRTEPGVIRSLRSCCRTTSLLAAVRSPETFSPDALFPENVKTGMVSLSSILYLPRSVIWSSSGSIAISYFEFQVIALVLRRCGSFRHSRTGRPVDQTCAAIDHFLQLILVTRTQQRRLQSDLLLEIRSGQRLVERLHAELLLS